MPTKDDSKSNLDGSLTALRGVGPALAKKLERLGLFRIEDLLFLLPLRYEDRTQLVKIGALVAGSRCLVTGEILLSETVYRGRRNLLVRISDGSGQLTLRFFHYSRQQQAQFQVGVRVTCFGDVRRSSAGLEMIHPEYRPVARKPERGNECFVDAGLPGDRRRAASAFAESHGPGIAVNARHAACRTAAEKRHEKLGMPSLAEAIQYLHRPPPDADLEQMLQRATPMPAAPRIRGTARSLPELAQPPGAGRNERRARTDRGSTRGRASSSMIWDSN